MLHVPRTLDCCAEKLSALVTGTIAFGDLEALQVLLDAESSGTTARVPRRPRQDYVALVKSFAALRFDLVGKLASMAQQKNAIKVKLAFDFAQVGS